MTWTSIAKAAALWLAHRTTRRGSRWGRPLHIQRFRFAQVQHLKAIEPNGAWRGMRHDVVQWMEDLEMSYWDRRIEARGSIVIAVRLPEKASLRIELRGPVTLKADILPGESMARARYHVTNLVSHGDAIPLAFVGVALIRIPDREVLPAMRTMSGNWMTRDLIRPEGQDQPPKGTIAIGEFRASLDTNSVEEAQQPIRSSEE